MQVNLLRHDSDNILLHTGGHSLRGQMVFVLLLCGWDSFPSDWGGVDNHPQEVEGVYVGRSLGRVTNCHHRGGRSPSLRAGGRASVLGPPGGVSASSWATWNQTGDLSQTILTGMAVNPNFYMTCISILTTTGS